MWNQSPYKNPRALTWEEKRARAYQRRPQHWGPLCWNYCTQDGSYNHGEAKHRVIQCQMHECRCPCHHEDAPTAAATADGKYTIAEVEAQIVLAEAQGVKRIELEPEELLLLLRKYLTEVMKHAKRDHYVAPRIGESLKIVAGLTRWLEELSEDDDDTST